VEENENSKEVPEKKEAKEEVRPRQENELERLIRLQTERMGKT
jgi:hypothetical protein